PFAIWFAAATFMTSLASGSIRGWAGFDGQIGCALLGPAAAAVRPAIAGSAGPGPLPSDAKRRNASGAIARTAGLCCRSRVAPGVIVAETALMIVKLCTCVAPTFASSARTPACDALAALALARADRPRAGRLLS